jgi:hypothetical protein
MINTPIPADLLRQTAGHGYEAGCECDLEGGDSDCKIQLPYETVGAYIKRLLKRVIEAEARNKELRRKLTSTYAENLITFAETEPELWMIFKEENGDILHELHEALTKGS